MKLKAIMAAGAAVLAVGSAGASAASYTGNVAVANDYVFRGVSQNLREPAVQAGMDYSFGDTGFYVGTWGSNIDFGQDGGEGVDPVDLNVEVDFILGYAGSFTEVRIVLPRSGASSATGDTAQNS